MDDRAKKLTDLKKLTLENQKLSGETITLAWKNQVSLEINAELYLAKLQAENQKQSEEVLALSKRNTALLEMQCELYKKARGLFFEPIHQKVSESEKDEEEHQLSEDRREQ